MLIDQKRLDAVARQRTHPANREANRLLPPEWGTPGTLPLVALAMWGVETGLVKELARAKLAAAVASLDRDDPAEAMAALASPELPALLKAATTPEEGAAEILDLLATKVRALT